MDISFAWVLMVTRSVAAYFFQQTNNVSRNEIENVCQKTRNIPDIWNADIQNPTCLISGRIRICEKTIGTFYCVSEKVWYFMMKNNRYH